MFRPANELSNLCCVNFAVATSVAQVALRLFGSCPLQQRMPDSTALTAQLVADASSRTEQTSISGRQQPQQSSANADHYRSLAQDSQDYQAEDNIDTKFLELERRTLESMMQASSMSSDQASTRSSDSSANKQRDERASSGAQAGTSGTAAEGSNWWQSATDKLEGLKNDIGSLEAHQAREMAKDVTTILTRMINARVMRGQDPKVIALTTCGFAVL